MLQLEWELNYFGDEIYTVDYPTIIKDFQKSGIGHYEAYEENGKWYLSDDDLGNIIDKEFDDLEVLKKFAQNHYELKLAYNIARLEFGWHDPKDVDINIFAEDSKVQMLTCFEVSDGKDIYIAKRDKTCYLVEYEGGKVVGRASSYEDATKLAEKLHKEFLINYFGITQNEYTGDDFDFDFSYAGVIISKIRYHWESKESGIAVCKDGTNISSHFPKDDIRNIKITNKHIGLFFTIKRQYPNFNIDHLLNTSFRFALDVCWLGEKIENKGIVSAISKKEERPTMKTLKENGFHIDNNVYQTLDLNKIEDIKILFNSYKYE